MKKNKYMTKQLLLAFLMLMSFFTGYSQRGTIPIEFEPKPVLFDPKLSPEGVLEKVYDRYGKEYSLSDIMIITPGRRMLQRAQQITCSSTSYFNLYFEDGCGMENTADPVHNARRAVVCKVFEDLSNFINSPLTASGKKVNIWVKDIASGSAPAGVLGSASSYYIAPSNNSITTGGILDGEIWKTIHLGQDSYTNLGSSVNLYHGEIAFNFADANIQWHTDLTTNAPSNLYDLYTVVLHEVTHALGFGSFINQNGASITGAGYYSRYDTFLRTNANVPLLTIGGCSMYNVNFNSAVSPTVLRPGCTLPDNLGTGSLNTTVCNNAIRYVGSSTVPVYTPTCFELGSSLSHFEDMLYPSCASPNGNDTYFVVSNSIAKGVTKRYLKAEERRTLCDMGYSVKTTYGSSTTSGGFFNYGGTVCGGIIVAGLNDGVSANGSYTFSGAITTTGGTSTNVAISGNILLSNDVNATGFECLQDITGAATLSATAGTSGTTVNFTTAVPGLHLLRYVPINGTQRGNITYLYVYIIPPPNPGGCSPTPTACNMVMNGDFEQYSTLPTQISQIIRACGWSYPNANAQYSPSYFNGLVLPGSTTFASWVGVPCNIFGFQAANNNIGNGYAQIRTSRHGGKEHLYTMLKAPLSANTTYQLSFDVSLCDGMSGYAGYLQAYLSNTAVLPINSNMDVSIPNPANLLTSPSIIRNSGGWDTITFTFTTTTGGEQYLYLGLLNNAGLVTNTAAVNNTSCTYNNNNQGPDDYQQHFRGYYLDNVVLIPTNGATFELPTAVCSTQRLNDLSIYLSDVDTDGVFSGPGVSVAGGIYSFNPSVTGVGTFTIAYTYTNSSGCPTTLYDTINVTTTSTNTIPVDAVNDNFSSIPVNGITGGLTPSVYSNDNYNGVLSTPASLSNVSFALVNPISITGASIDGTGVINVPANTPSGTYTLTYSLSGTGNCNATDTATVVIVVNGTSTLPGIRANNSVNNIGLQSTGKIIISGYFTTYNNVSKINMARLNTDLTLDPAFTYTGNQEARGMAIQSDNKVIVVAANPIFGGTSCVARLLPDGGVDTSFNVGGVGTARHPSLSNNIGHAAAIQTDGKILVGGDFYYYNGVQKLGIARLLSNGTVDATFNPTELNTYFRSVVHSITVQPDGKIILLGVFSPPVAGATAKNIVRLNANGTLDAGFLAGDTAGTINYQDLDVSIYSPLTRATVQPDGKIVVVGGFTKYNGTNTKCIVRLLSNGQIDPTFNTTTGVDRGINTVIMEPVTNKIIIGGEFTTFNGSAVKKMIRLNTNGTWDTTFSIGSGTTDLPGSSSCPFCYNHIRALKLQPDGKVIVGGRFKTFNGLSAGFVTRISGDAGLQSRGTGVVYVSEPEIDTNPTFSNIKVYPNPSSDLFNIDLSQESAPYSSINVYNLLGAKVFTAALTPKENNVIDLSHLSAGYYTAKLENGASTATFKLVKN